MGIARTTLVSISSLGLMVGGFAATAGTAFAASPTHSAYNAPQRHSNNGGDGGNGGDAQSNCGIPIGLSLGVLGKGGDVSQCNARGGDGGNGGDSNKHRKQHEHH